MNERDVRVRDAAEREFVQAVEDGRFDRESAALAVWFGVMGLPAEPRDVREIAWARFAQSSIAFRRERRFSSGIVASSSY